MATTSIPRTNQHRVTEGEIGELIARASKLKRELIDYAAGPEFQKRLGSVLKEAAGRGNFLDEGSATRAVDHFALQYRLPNGRTVVERFVTQRRPRLSVADREMMLGWRDVVEGIFEVTRFDGDGDAVELRNLVDDLDYRAHSNLGRQAFTALNVGAFVICRIVPLSPASGVWLISGHMAAYPESDGTAVAQVAVKAMTTDPRQLRRNPPLLRRAWEMQAGQRADFIAQTGSDMVVVGAGEAQDILREHYRRLQDKALWETGERDLPAHTVPEADELGRLPEGLLEAETVALIYDDVDGLNFYADFGRLDALFAEAAAAGDAGQVVDPAGLDQLEGYLHDESVAPLAIRRLVDRHPEGADPVFRALLGKPGFTWSRDGEKLLRRCKPTFFGREPVPSVTVLGERLAQLVGTAE